MRIRARIAFICTALSACVAYASTPLGTAFTYQGELKENGSPVNDTCDFEFSLFEDAGGVTQIGPTQTILAVPVANGLFTVELNSGEEFGPNAFSGDERYLKMAVKTPPDVDFTPLSPLQKLTAAPVAHFALNTAGGSGDDHSLDAADGDPVDALFVDDDGNVGIGTMAPGKALDVSGDVAASGAVIADVVNAVAHYNLGGIRVLGTPGVSNTVVGMGTANFLTTGSNNAFFGRNAGNRNTTGQDNAFFGRSAGSGNSTGSENSFFGRSAGSANDGGSFNSFFGSDAGIDNTEGVFNVFVGASAGRRNTEGSSNTMVGPAAGPFNTTGELNAFFGQSAGRNNATGTRNTYIGSYAGPQDDNLNLTNATAIGYRALATQDNTVVLGSIAGVNSATDDTNVGIGTTSPVNRLTVIGDTGLIGDVGIGTTSPGARLSVRGETNTQTARFSGPEGNYRFLQDLNASNEASWTFRNGTTGEPALTIVSDGRVGMGVNSIDARLHIKGTDTRIAKIDRFGSDGELVAFARDDLVKGSITVSGNTVSYNAFTGSHYACTDEPLDRGMLVALTGKNQYLHGDRDSEIVYGITASASPNNPKCLGAYLGLQDPSKAAGPDNPHLVMAEGNGELWVVDTGRDIEPGEYLVASHVRGHAMVDDADASARRHIVARAAEQVAWNGVTECTGTLKHKRISVLFESFCRGKNSARDMRGLAVQMDEIVKQKDAEIASQKQQIGELTARLERVEAMMTQLFSKKVGGQ